MSWLDAFSIGPPGPQGPPGPGNNSLLLFLGLVQAQGSMGLGGPSALRVVRPSTDFPGKTTATLRLTAWVDVNNSSPPPAWATSTNYTAGDWVQNPGPLGSPVAYLCTTSGMSASSGPGPNTLGTNIHDGGAVWRSAAASIQVVLIDSGGQSVAAVSAPANIASASTGAGVLELTADLSSALIPLAQRAIVLVTVAGDPSDSGMTSFTAGFLSYAAIDFS